MFSIKLCSEIVFLEEIGLSDEIISMGITKKKKLAVISSGHSPLIQIDLKTPSLLPVCLCFSATWLQGKGLDLRSHR